SVRNVEPPALPSKFDLTLTAHMSDTAVKFELVHHRDRYDTVMMRALLDQVRTLLAGAAADPSRGILEYPLQAPENVPAAPALRTEEVSRPEPPAARHMALADGSGFWTYAQMYAAADRTARSLAARGEGNVAVIKRPTAGFAVAALGCALADVPFSAVAADPGLAHHPFPTTLLGRAPGEDTPETAIDVRALLAEAADTAGEGPVPVVDDWTAGRYGFGRQDRFA